MHFLNGDYSMPPGYRRRRFFAFLIDISIVIALWYIAYKLFGQPDFYTLKAAMDGYTGVAERTPEMASAVLAAFNAAFLPALCIWFGYEVLTTLALSGRTIGKLLMGLQIVSINPRNGILNALLLILRSALKMLSLYIFQSVPFLICCLTVFGNKDGRSGFDTFVRTKVIDTRAAAAQEEDPE